MKIFLHLIYPDPAGAAGLGQNPKDLALLLPSFPTAERTTVVLEANSSAAASPSAVVAVGKKTEVVGGTRVVVEGREDAKGREDRWEVDASGLGVEGRIVDVVEVGVDVAAAAFVGGESEIGIEGREWRRGSE